MQDKVILVTGGASGLGKTTAQNLIKTAGIKVAILDLPSSDGRSVVEEISSDDAIFTPADVTSESEVAEALTKIKQTFGRLDVVVHCAGIRGVGLMYDFEKKQPHSLNVFKNVLNVNLVGTFNVVRLSVGLLSENEPVDGQRGVIITVGSILGFEGGKNHISYAATKAAIMGMTLPLAREFGHQGIRVCNIAPGHFDAPMHNTLSPDRKTYFEEKAASSPFPKRLGKPSEFAHLVRKIIENNLLNAEVIRLDAGARFNS